MTVSRTDEWRRSGPRWAAQRRTRPGVVDTARRRPPTVLPTPGIVVVGVHQDLPDEILGFGRPMARARHRRTTTGGTDRRYGDGREPYPSPHSATTPARLHRATNTGSRRGRAEPDLAGDLAVGARRPPRQVTTRCPGRENLRTSMVPQAAKPPPMPSPTTLMVSDTSRQDPSESLRATSHPTPAAGRSDRGRCRAGTT